ncbi:MAG: prepilin-type N-terminal cleavage/methylation domain-containing protein [Nitrospirae bacterium]|nr:prepilin-type N-terminal cleavage/methylation domain-containing protein [Candidatus Troglogloeales bacterium]MBI3598870.1 prepilin-type N-terminal cleavage/methylation domain-containing protein [Candidatus Troglogloeales bacterium]
MKSLSSGFALIELLFSMAIMLIVLGSFYGLTSFIYRDYAGQIALAETRQESRVATTFFQNEIQNAGLDPSGTAFNGGQLNTKIFPNCKQTLQTVEPIIEASETVFHFMGDKNANGNNGDSNEDVRYEWVGEKGEDGCKEKRTPYTLYRDTGGGQQEVALGIQSFRLDYFDENGTLLPAGFLTKDERIKIRKVVLTLRPLTKNDTKKEEREWTSEIYLKNIG